LRKKRLCLALAAMICLLSAAAPGLAVGTFADTEFQGKFTTENLDAIIEKYELYNGWYWTTPAGEAQTYHGREDEPGWTDTAVNVMHKTEYDPAFFGCRWDTDAIDARMPNSCGFGECFGFAQFIGYLLSGCANPHRDWQAFYSVQAAGGLKVGDLVRAEYRKNQKRYYHSAIVYSVEGDTVLFLQVSGVNFNLLRIRQGYTDGNLVNETSQEALSALPGIKIMRWSPKPR